MFVLALIVALVLVLLSSLMFFGSSKWDPQGKHCYITGGSTGLGLELAKLLTKKGANVSIVARNEQRLAKATEELEKSRQTPDQILKSYSFSLYDPQLSADALDAACEPYGGRSPDAVFLCAGASRPSFWIENTPENLRQGMDDGYWVQAWSALAAAKRMAKDGVKGKLVLVGSVLSYFSIVGYSPYSPAKFAIRGLAETLRQELLLYHIDVHVFFPATIYTTGYERENETKPKITLKIEESDDGQKPEDCAAALYQGIQRGDFHINGEFLGNVFRCSSRGSTPHNNVIMDCIYGLIGSIALPLWRRGVDKTVIGHRKEHQEYLESTGFFEDPVSKK